MKRALIISTAIVICQILSAANNPFDLTGDWKAKVRSIAPVKGMAEPKHERHILLFSLTTGFQHWAIPHTEAVVEILGETSGTYKAHSSNDIEQFLPRNLKKYDAVILNNNCPDREHRDIFMDVLINKVDTYGIKYRGMSMQKRKALAKNLFNSLMNYVRNGGGLVLLHGAIANFNYNDDFSEMVGGSFDFHPKQREVRLEMVQPNHPLVKHFNGNPLITYDEPYMFNRAYEQLNFLPLMEMDIANLSEEKSYDKIKSMPRYTAWIKPHGKGRVFFTSPSHNAQDFENPDLLLFMLGGIQYAIGDLDCRDTR